ncbi:MAG: class I SAM-dependent methyltransferase [Candidatus Moraniibacteriota bacterium]
MKSGLIKKILSETESGYDLIADKFSQTRSRFWKELGFIGRFAKKGGRILDFGCGNGRLLEILRNKDIDYVGVDVSAGLIDLAEKNYKKENGFKKINFLKIDNAFKYLPFQKECFGVVYSIAVFHHIPDSQKRLEIAKELYRLVERGGYVVVTVWNLWGSGHKKNYRKLIFGNWRDKLLGKSALDWNDCWINFTDNQGNEFKRFHHAFTKRELKKLFLAAGFSEQFCGVIRGNIVFLGRKKGK